MNDQWGSTKSVIALMIGDNEERRMKGETMYVHCTRMAGDVDKAKGKLHLTQSKVRSVLRALLLIVEFHELFKMWRKRSLSSLVK